MTFNSLTFGAFLFVVLGLHFLWPRSRWRGEKVALLAASYLFYGWWDARFLSLLLLSTAIDHAAVRGIRREPDRRRAWLTLSIVSNLTILGFFKYWNFFVDGAAALASDWGFDPGTLRLDLVLPIGISFYTFQTMSLTIDAYRGRLRHVPSLLDVALYVAFFPQLVAGPIVRANTFLAQTRRKPRVRIPLLMWGGWLIILGLFKKTVIADNLAVLVDAHVASPGLAAAPAVASWKAALAFSFQIYGDFSGYSDIAIGIAAVMGIRFPRNFRAPYVSASLSDFWRRWHISLSTWLRDYLYIPLGGSRGPAGRTRANLMVTMLLGGLWHGAGWNFVLWGGLHGVFLVIEHLRSPRRTGDRPRGLVADALRTAGVFLAVTLLWIPFRCRDGGTALAMFRSMALNWTEVDFSTLTSGTPWLAVGLLMTGTCFLSERGTLPRRGPAAARVLACIGMIYAVMHYAGGSRAFIYFQF